MTGKPLAIRLFDGPLIEFGEGEVQERFRSKKVGALLAYLALNLGRRCPREQIAAALWPEESDEQAVANRLRVTLASLRRQLEPAGSEFDSVLDVGIPGMIRLREDRVWCDVSEFDRARREGRLADAARLLRGPLMPGYYDDWLRESQLGYEVLADDLKPSESAEPLPAASHRSQLERRLPLYLTRLFGRSEELRALIAAIDEDRLVTLAGPGGIGKTRLAVEAAKTTPRACTFVPLAELGDPSRVAEAALGAFGIAFRRDTPALDQLCSVLNQRPPMLLVLDNAEHLVEAVGEFALELLHCVPTLRLLVTSRHRLEVGGERILTLDPLGAPDSGAEVGSALTHPSVELFLDRARHVRPDFRPTPQAAESIVAICQKLEGFPLAIELAAVRVAAQSPTQICEDLSANLLTLKSRQRGLPERHRSLRATMQGSYDLLPPSLQALFRKLSIFEGGWTASAARSITQDDGAEPGLEELAIRSLISVDPLRDGAATRYTFLAPLRSFAADQLDDAERADCRRRHSQYFLALAAKADDEDVRTFRPLDPEQENLIAALANGNHADPTFWQALGGAIEHAFVRGRHRLASRWIDAYSDQFANIPDLAARTRVRNAACQILPDVDRIEAARQMARDMRSDAVDGGYEPGIICADIVLGYVAEFAGSLDEGLGKHRQALAAGRTLNDRKLLASCLAHASGTLHDAAILNPEGSSERAEMLAESERYARELRDLLPPFSRRKPLAPLLLGTALSFQGRKEEAVDSYQEAQRHSLELGTTTERMYAYVFESEINCGWGRFERAALLFGAFQALRERMGYSLDRAQYVRTDWITRLDDSLRKALGEERYDSLLLEGREANPRRIMGHDLADR